MKKVGSRKARATSLGIFALMFGCSGAVLCAEYTGTVLATGLNNPRDLAFGPDGALYIAEAGIAAGLGPSTALRGETLTHTQTGSVTRYEAGSQTRVSTGLASIYGSTSGQVNGPNGIAFNATGAPQVAIGLGLDPRTRFTDLSPGGAGLARLLGPGGAVDIGGYEAINNPAGGPIDSNPWHLAIIQGEALLTDAGGNSLLRVGNDGSVSTVATFASRVLGGSVTIESVPTGVAVGPDGAYYVGELTGAPFVPGAAQIYRIAQGGTPTVFATGFTMISDLVFGPNGSLYALEYDSNGSRNPGSAGTLWEVTRNGFRSFVFGDLTNPTGVEIGSDGAFYVSNFGASSGGGQVVRIAADVPEPETYALMLVGLSALGLFGRTRRVSESVSRFTGQGAGRSRPGLPEPRLSNTRRAPRCTSTPACRSGCPPLRRIDATGSARSCESVLAPGLEHRHRNRIG